MAGIDIGRLHIAEGDGSMHVNLLATGLVQKGTFLVGVQAACSLFDLDERSTVLHRESLPTGFGRSLDGSWKQTPADLFRILKELSALLETGSRQTPGMTLFRKAVLDLGCYSAEKPAAAGRGHTEPRTFDKTFQQDLFEILSTVGTELIVSPEDPVRFSREDPVKFGRVDKGPFTTSTNFKYLCAEESNPLPKDRFGGFSMKRLIEMVSSASAFPQYLQLAEVENRTQTPQRPRQAISQLTDSGRQPTTRVSY